MSEDNNTFEISRRKTLAALGTIGAASAGAGLGTSAWFSDTESFEDNTITAGELDLKVDWEEHYYDGGAESVEIASNPEEADFFLPAVEPRQMSATANLASRTRVRPIALNFTEGSDLDTFWEETAIEAFPDVESEEPDAGDYDGQQDEIEGDICEYPADLDGVLSHPFRTGGAFDDGVTIGEGPNPQTTKPGDSLVSISDVKPGDFGEVTLSFHLCDNPGYVWLTGELTENLENGLTEPEAADPEEDDAMGDEEMEGELLDKILTRMWYDGDCDNQLDELEGELDLMIAVDVSGSIESDEQTAMMEGINEFVNQLPGNDVQVGSVNFGNNEITGLQGLTDPESLTVDLTGADFAGNTPMPAAIDIADQAVRNDANAREGAEKAVVVFTDGGPNYQNEQYSAGDYDAPRDETAAFSAESGNNTYDNADTEEATVSVPEMEETGLVADTVRDAGTRIATIFVGGDEQDAMTEDAISMYGTLPEFLGAEVASPGFSFTAAFQDLEDLSTDLVESIVVSEEVFFIGTLGQALERLEQGNGIPLDGNLDTAFDEIFDPGDDPDREPFAAGETDCIAMEWWLPINHGNEVQGDSVGFNLGFYTEQARHNDGAGLPPENTSAPNGTTTVEGNNS
ncbi:VWA domain-containing protein [Halodesulfurarchaeum sp. HSR-GB]|uniref:vWA domain-containing protein n=1 Tax=Halodesulfurarchaeum sp. HSR-GB TaxID=3074077 RepID=UPI002862E4B0|nr:VWA domain-containing protein [Halodesulfurarchaeum sp. HSR-GB]MDR5657342.1 VWA domain-containing protein [Halodesulfurarchaeum sp. HSR-GB]